MAKKKANTKKKNNVVKKEKFFAPQGYKSKIQSERLSEVAHAVCALTDPFCAHAEGARIPDENSAHSVAHTLRAVHMVSTDANGSAAFSVNPNVTFGFDLATTIVGTTVTVWGGPSAWNGTSLFANNFEKMRIVSWGVKMIPVMAPANQSGFCYVNTLAHAVTSGIDLAAGIAMEKEVFPIHGGGFAWVSRPMGHEWKEYRDVVMGSDHSYTKLACLVVGAPASTTNAFAVEITVNLEAIPVYSAIAAGLATPGVPHRPHVLQTASHVQTKTKAAYQSGDDLGKTILYAVGDGLKFVAKEALGYMLGGVPGAIAALGVGSGRGSKKQIVDYMEVD